MKRFSLITIAYMLITITHISARDRFHIIRNVSPSLVEIVNARKATREMYYLKDSLNRNWSTYTYVEDEVEGVSALVSDYASEVFILQGDSLKRQGWPEQHFALQHSAYALNNGKLFGYGGYGYWTSKNILRYWSAEKGWIPILISDQSPVLVPSHNATLVIRDSTAIIIGGERTDLRNPFLRHEVKLIQKVNLRNRMVELIKIQFDLGQDQLLVENDSLLVFKDESELISFNPLKMSFSQTVITEEIDLVLRNHFLDKTYEETLIKLLKPEKNITHDKSLIWLIFFLLLFLFALVLRLSQKSNPNYNPETKQIFITGDRIIYGKNSTALTNYQIDILNYLMEKGFGTTQDLNSQFSAELSTSHLNKLRSDAIKAINSKVQILSNNQINDLILFRKAKKDSRMVEYYINLKYQLERNRFNE